MKVSEKILAQSIGFFIHVISRSFIDESCIAQRESKYIKFHFLKFTFENGFRILKILKSETFCHFTKQSSDMTNGLLMNFGSWFIFISNLENNLDENIET